MAAPMTGWESGKDLQIDVFRQQFKYYKRKQPFPDLSRVVDFKNGRNYTKISSFNLNKSLLPEIQGVAFVEEWKAYRHDDFPGFVFILNPFTHGHEKYWVKRCLHDYPCQPNVCNLDAHTYRKESDNLWDLKQSGEKDDKGKSLLDKLRWVTLGYHHDWDTKEYSPECRSAFPDDLGQLSRYVAAALGCPDYTAEAAIVNYYHSDSTLSGHTDHSEFDSEAPLISFSFGLPAIFLLGGTTKDVTPLPVFIRSGDVTVLMGESRLAYHAVPKILSSGVVPTWDTRSSVVHSVKGSGAGQAGGCVPDGVAVTSAEADSPVDCGSAVGSDGALRNEKSMTVAGSEVIHDGHELKTPATNASDSCSQEIATVEAGLNIDAACSGSVVCKKIKTEREGDDGVNADIVHTLETLDWEPYEAYLRHNRINMNVRQVFKPGQGFPSKESPD